jgi:hypothetical protein
LLVQPLFHSIIVDPHTTKKKLAAFKFHEPVTLEEAARSLTGLNV